MRMWMVNPKIMCRQHLIGEYRELFTFVGSLKKGISMKGYIENDLLEPLSLYKRYEELRKEMLKRGYAPVKTIEILRLNKSTLKENELNHRIDKGNSLLLLLSRCNECSKRYDAFKEKNLNVMKGGCEKWLKN